MNLPTEIETYNNVCKRLEAQEPFTFTRFGDGEWYAITGQSVGNADKHKYFPDLREQLRQIVKQGRGDNYMFALQSLAIQKMGDKISKIANSNIEWYNSNCFVQASTEAKIDRYFDALRKNRLIMVAPDYLRKFEGYNGFVSVPRLNCWLEKDRIIEDVKSQLGEEHTVVSVSASMAANVIVDELYQLYGDTHTFIDAGSVYDPYVGVRTRGYHDKIIKRLKNN